MPEPGGAEGRVGLVIPTLDGGPRFREALARWRGQQGVGALEICCPDSGSSDGTVEAIRESGARLLPIPRSEFNHGATRNRGLSLVLRDFVILSVQDALPVGPGVAAALVAPLLADPGLAATYGRQVPRPGCHPVLVERIGAWAGSTEPQVQALAGRAWSELSPWERLALVRYDHVIACVRRAAWEERRIETLSFGEDVAWAAKVVQAGGRIAFVPEAVVEHSHDRSAWDEARRIYCDHRNLSRLLGLVTVPRLDHVRRNVAAAREHYRALVAARTDADDETRAAWTEWSDLLARYENWAQYLGGNLSHRWWFAPIDRWLRQGI